MSATQKKLPPLPKTGPAGRKLSTTEVRAMKARREMFDRVTIEPKRGGMSVTVYGYVRDSTWIHGGKHMPRVLHLADYRTDIEAKQAFPEAQVDNARVPRISLMLPD